MKELTTGLKVQASAIFAHAGNRSAQEDHSLILEDKRIFAIADGFGGPTPGALASQTACESVRGFLFKEAGDNEATLPYELRPYFSLAGNVLFNALIHANRKVKKLNKGKDVHEKGGASLLAGFMDGDLLALANVGACSAWLFREGQAKELVTPRTYARLYDPMNPESRTELQIPLMAVGITESLEPEIFEYRLKPGDWLLLQTDGISTEVREKILELHKKAQNEPTSGQDSIREAKSVLESSQYSDNAAASLLIF